MSSIEIHEFTRGFRDIKKINDKWVSGGYNGEVGPHNYKVPERIKEAVHKNCFRINDNYPPKNGDVGLIARNIDEYSILAVAAKLDEDGKRPGVTYRYFWLDRQAYQNIDGIGTLILWWETVKTPHFSFDTYDKFQLNYSASICKLGYFNHLLPNVEHLIPNVNVFPYLFGFTQENEQKKLDYKELHYIALKLNQEENNQLAWAWNVPQLDYPEDFNLIYCADTQSCKRISKSIKQSRQITSVSFVQPELQYNLVPSSTNNTNQSVSRTNNTFVNQVRECIKAIYRLEDPKEDKFLELIHYVEGEAYPIEDWNWEDIIDKTTLNHNHESTARYKALLAILNPNKEFLFVWLTMLQENQEYRKTSLYIQKQLWKIICSNDKKIACNYLKNNINACIIQLLRDAKSDRNTNNIQQSQIEWLLIQSNSLWTFYFDRYAKKLLPKLIRRLPDERDIFYTDILSAWGQWQLNYEQTKCFMRFPEYKFLAKLFGKIKKYSLSSFFYQLGEGSVPVDIASNREADFFLIKVDEKKKSGLQDDKKKFSLLPSFPELASWNNGLLNLLVPLAVALIVVALFVPPNFIKDIFGANSSEQLDNLGGKQDQGTHGTVKPVGSFLDTWNRWKQNGDAQAKKLIIQYLQTSNSIENKQASEFIYQWFTTEVKLSNQETSKTNDIKLIQEILKFTEYYNGDIDGKLGQNSRDYIKKFQTSQRLEATGELDVKTIRSILHLFRQKQVGLVRDLLINSFTRRISDEDINKDIQELDKCKKTAIKQPQNYNICIDQVMNNINDV